MVLISEQLRVNAGGIGNQNLQLSVWNQKAALRAIHTGFALEILRVLTHFPKFGGYFYYLVQ